jgi:hypothetical protein
MLPTGPVVLDTDLRGGVALGSPVAGQIAVCECCL